MANVLKMEKKVAVIAQLVDGASIRTVERTTGVHRDTIMRLMVEVGTKCAVLMDEMMVGIKTERFEVDEMWGFVGMKQKRALEGDKAEGKGDAYTYVAIDPVTKVVPCFLVGKRDSACAKRFMADLASRVVGRIQLTTDGFEAYIDAVEQAFGCNVDYAMLIKEYHGDSDGAGRYSPAKLKKTKRIKVAGNPDERFISTSLVERQNLTMRMCQRRLTRLTNAFSKKLDNLKAAVALHFAYYNLVRPHITIRMTPAMAAEITDHEWTIEDLITWQPVAEVARAA